MMAPLHESSALVVLLRTGKRPWNQYAALVEENGSAVAVLEQEQGGQGRLFAADDELAAAETHIKRWDQEGMRLLTVLDPDYPENLRSVHDRPPLIFLAGRLEPRDSRSIAVVGTRDATPEGAATAGAIAEHLVDRGYTVISGLAAGIDTAVHTAALERGGRTVAVIGTGLRRAYPPQNAVLQRTIASEGAVISQFWPHSPPSRRSFPLRNAVMSGLTLASVVVEASSTSGSRMQARLALEHGRPVFLMGSLLVHDWAREFATRPGTHVVRSAEEITTIVERLNSSGALVP
jgi:DNA processing protein